MEYQIEVKCNLVEWIETMTAKTPQILWKCAYGMARAARGEADLIILFSDEEHPIWALCTSKCTDYILFLLVDEFAHNNFIWRWGYTL